MKKAATSVAALLIGSISTHLYMKNIEPKWIETVKIDLTHPLIPNSFDHFKIVLFSDTHLGFQFDLTQMERVVEIISNEDPDLIVFSGDLVDNLLSFFEWEQTIQILRLLSAPMGKFAVYGNHDHGGWGSNKYKQIMESSGFTILQNEAVSIKNEAGDQFILAGIDDAMLGKPDFKKTFSNHPEKTFTILISHAPDLADEAASYPVHYQLSGHSHGGQVQFPFIGPVITPPYGRKYYEGLYSVTKSFSVYVNRGLGTTRLPYRLFARPEITTFTFKSVNNWKED
ncbi:metallophosphoesterase [Fervidibacillus halotolerans]|uniref:Metallophosphoesterase n=1 Tax=Fervidibacillus halotolerans TaxID=2980027 RepID=A0A9E8M2H8_9BACI|nr:metallophosphoesterase [Fervidibacillus halotolerans]WAA13224.1 metallophosphoesterase [Fervidibacillus halotolerans]